MTRTFAAAIGLFALVSLPAAAQDVKATLGNATKAMGVETLTSIHYYGVAQTGNLGQNNNANQPWPMANASDYVRAIDFSQPASRATWVTYRDTGSGRRGDPGTGAAERSRLRTRRGRSSSRSGSRRGDSSKAQRRTTRRCSRRRSRGGATRPSRGTRRSSHPAASRIAWSGSSTIRTSSSASRRGSSIRSSATCSSKRSTFTIAIPTA